MLLSYSAQFLFFSVGLLTPNPFLQRHHVVLAALSAFVMAVLAWKVVRASRFFRRPDGLTACFGLVSLLLLALYGGGAWLQLSASDAMFELSAALAFFVLATLMLPMGSLLLVSPRLAVRVNELCGGIVRLEVPLNEGTGLQLRKRLSGALLSATGVLLIVVGSGFLREVLHG